VRPPLGERQVELRLDATDLHALDAGQRGNDLLDPLLDGGDLVLAASAELEADPDGAIENADLLDEARSHDVLIEARPGHGSKLLPDLLARRTLH